MAKITFSQQLLHWQWWKEPKTLMTFIYLLLRADEDGRIGASLSSISKDTGLSIQEVRTSLCKLEKSKDIVRDKQDRKANIITITSKLFYKTLEASTQIATQRATQIATQRATQIATQDTGSNNRCLEEMPTQIATQKLTQTPAQKSTKKNADWSVIPSFVAEPFKTCFADWIEYKHARREDYKTEKSVKACYNNLLRLSDGHPKNAVLIVENAMGNNWRGLYPIKDNNYPTPHTTGYGTNDGRKEQRIERINDAAKLVRKLVDEADGSIRTD